jgi:KDO2-lipid IV(A) lauroyltransferase
MDPAWIANSPIGLPLGLFLGRVLRRSTGMRIAEALARRQAREREAPVVRAIRSNQGVVRGLPLRDPALDDAVLEVLRHAARGYVDLLWALARGRRALRESSSLDASTEEIFRDSFRSGRGAILAAPHMSNFDFLLLTLADRGYPVQALSYVHPTAAHRLQNAIRRSYDLDITPVSIPSLRQAVRKLRGGGAVLTGVDRPDPSGQTLTFFGRPACLPTGHARLALQTGAPILVGAVQSEGDAYRGVVSDVIEPPRAGSRSDGRALAQRVLEGIERFVRARPGEWLVFLPVWPGTG